MDILQILFPHEQNQQLQNVPFFAPSPTPQITIYTSVLQAH